MYVRPVVKELSADAENCGCCWVFINGQATQVPAACNNGNFPTCQPGQAAGIPCVIRTPQNSVANVVICGYQNPFYCGTQPH